MSATTTSKRYAYLDGLRAVAIGAVVSLHWLRGQFSFLRGGSVGVDVFFVLSGFIITTVLWRSDSSDGTAGAWRSFVWRRLKRLYPALVGLAIGMVVLYAVVPDSPVSVPEVCRRGLLALTQTSAVAAVQHHGSLWLPALHPFTQTWSLSIEWYFYLLWPLVLLSARARRADPRRLAVTLIGVAALFYLVALPTNTFWFYFGPLARFAELLAGAALSIWLTNRAARPPLRSADLASSVALVTVAAITVLAPPAESHFYRFVSLPVTVLCTLVVIYGGYAGSAGSLANRLLTLPWMTAIGRSSYSLYLWHLPVILLIDGRWLHVSKPVLGLVVLSLTAAFTTLSYLFLEKPFMRPRTDALRPRAQEPETGTRLPLRS